MEKRAFDLADYGDTSKEAIGRRLKAVRAVLGLSQEDMAIQTGMDPKVFQHRESARSMLTPGEAWAIYTRYDLDPRFLLFGNPVSVADRWPAIVDALRSQDEQRALRRQAAARREAKSTP